MKFLNKIAILTVLIFLIILVNIFHYFNVQQKNEEYVDICNKEIENFRDIVNVNNDIIGVTSHPEGCYCRMYTRLLPRLLVYKVKHNKKELEFIRPSHNEYVVPTLILEKADAFLSYGIADDIDFEYVISSLYKKNLYAYDCGVKSISKKNEYLTFESQCIGLDDYILKNMGHVSSGEIHSLGEKLKELKLENKKIYLKMDIAGAELEIIPDVIKYHKNLTGMNIVIKYDNSAELIKVESLLKDIEKNFVLVARNEMPGKKYCRCNYKNHYLSGVVSLAYINKEFVDKKTMPFKQSYTSNSDYKQLYKLGDYIPKFDIDWILILSEKIKLLFGKSN